MAATASQAIQSTGLRIDKQPGSRDDLRILRRRQWDLNHVNPKERCIRILVRVLTGAPGQLFVLPDKRGSRHVDVNVVLVIRINDESMRVRATASLYDSYLLRIFDISNIEDSHAAETISLRRRRLLLFSGWRRWLWRWRRKSLCPAIHPAVCHFHRHEEQVFVNRQVALATRTYHRSQ